MESVPEWLYAVNGWMLIRGQWVDAHGNGFRTETVNAKPIKVNDLVGQNVSGMKAIITDPRYCEQFPKGMPFVTLRRVFIHQDTVGAKGPKVDWIRIEFDPLSEHHGCNFTGWTADSQPERCIYVAQQEA